jgi:hypothetical protein
MLRQPFWQGFDDAPVHEDVEQATQTFFGFRVSMERLIAGQCDQPEAFDANTRSRYAKMVRHTVGHDILAEEGRSALLWRSG